MSLSTGLGTGLLVASGSKLRAAGPAGVLVAYFITGICMLAPTINSVSELAIAYPGLPGGFQSYYAKFIDESLGFALLELCFPMDVCFGFGIGHKLNDNQILDNHS